LRQSSPNSKYYLRILIVISFFLCSTFYAKSAIKELEKFQQELIIAKDDTSRAKLLNDAAFLLRGNNPKLAMQYANLAMELSIKARYNKGKLNSYLVKGIIYKRLGDFEKAMQNYTNALQISDLMGDKLKISSCYNNIGSIYQAQKNYTKAILYFNKSLEIEQTLGKKDQVSIRLYNIGTIYEAMNKLDTAYNFYNQSLTIEETLDNEEGISFALYGLGGVLTKKGDFPKAEIYLKKAYDLAKKNSDISGMSYCLNELGALYMKWGIHTTAVSFFLQSISYADSLQEKNQIKETYYNLASAYADLKQYKDAYEYFVKYNTLNEEINNTDISRKIAEINTKYEVDKIDKELELMKKEGRIKELELNQQKNLRNFLIFSSIIVIILGLFNFNKKRSLEQNSKNSLSEKQSNDILLIFEKVLLSKISWAVFLCIYFVLYSSFIQPFGLAFLEWSEKWLIIAVYGAICLATSSLSFIIFRPWNAYFRKHSLVLKYILLSFLNITLLTFTLFFYNSIQGLNDFSIISLTDILFQVITISLLPVLMLVLFSERITYAQNLKDIPLDAISHQQTIDSKTIPSEKEEIITIKTDNINESIRLLYHQIICFEANDNYTAIYFLKEGNLKKELYRITLKKIEAQLIDYKEFIRCHKSFIINISFLRKISGNAQKYKMHFLNLDFEVPVSRSFPRQVIDTLKEATQNKE
jgi:tetratricopeptide (TPR) repeat protein